MDDKINEYAFIESNTVYVETTSVHKVKAGSRSIWTQCELFCCSGKTFCENTKQAPKETKSLNRLNVTNIN